MKHKRIFLPLLFLFSIYNQLTGHGFGADTPVILLYQYRTSICGKIVKQRMEEAQTLKKIYEHQIDKKIKVKSYHEQSLTQDYQSIKAAGISTTNCYVRIEFNNDTDNVIECSPMQTFYCVDTKEWISAYQLEPGDRLFSENPEGTRVSTVALIEKPFRVYTLEIKKYHTFLVGKDRILTHNMLLAPSLLLTLSFSFGEGAVAGGSAGSTFGPVAMGAGVALGGVIGIITACRSQDHKKIEYQVDFDAGLLARKQQPKKPKKDTKSTDDPEKSGNNQKDPDKDPDDKRNKIDWEKTTNKQDREDAEKLGYKETKNPPFNTRDRLAFKKGDNWITADSTGHNGGRWKMFYRTGRRIGTFDANLNFMKT